MDDDQNSQLQYVQVVRAEREEPGNGDGRVQKRDEDLAQEPPSDAQARKSNAAVAESGPAVPRVCCAVCIRPIDTVLKPLCDECFAKFYGGEL